MTITTIAGTPTPGPRLHSPWPSPRVEGLAVSIGYLRRKLTAAGTPTLAHTVPGVGYGGRRS